MATQPAKNIGQTFYLRYVLCEDEAQQTGMGFQVLDEDRVIVWRTFHGYDEWERDSEEILPVQEARDLYLKLISLDYDGPESCYGDKVWVVDPVFTDRQRSRNRRGNSDLYMDEVSGPAPGTYAYTARLMAGPNPTDEEAEFWDDWKEQMKAGTLY